MRVAVFTDYVYRRQRGLIYSERAFGLFLAGVGEKVDQLVVIGRITSDSDSAPARYPLPPSVRFVALPHYESLVHPGAVLASLVRSLRTMWDGLTDVDVAWILGPYPHSIALVLVALARRRPVVLGVRQDWPRYVRMRRPGRRWLHRAADVLEWMWRTLARRLPVVAVGPELARTYGSAPAVLELSVSVVPKAVVEAPPIGDRRDYGGELRVLSVGRLDPEKNPLLLADILAGLNAREPRWHLNVCGEGELAGGLEDRLRELGVAQHADLLGYIPMGERLLDLYRDSHALLHVSWTEGLPQVLVEAFATGLPVVATAVGGVRAGVGEAAVLIAPGDADAAVGALTRVAGDPALRARLVAAGRERASDQTIEAQTERLVAFLEGQAERYGRRRGR
jgi:glycosyltransferase involved in cell wall biosynthesis